MKIILPGGSGQVGNILTRALSAKGHECVVLSRRASPATDAPAKPGATPVRTVAWDGRTLGPWMSELDGADVVINLAGRSVNCRYHEANLARMMDSRVDSTRVVGEAIALAARPPRVWLQMSTATIYAHTYGEPQTETRGVIGGDEPGVPALWRRSVEIGVAWEKALTDAPTPHTRKVALRAAMVMSPDAGGVFSAFATLCRFGMGRQGRGDQFVSWIHEHDFVAAVEWLIANDAIKGAVNLAAPGPLLNRDFIAGIHAALGSRWSVPAPAWLLELGAVFHRTETELLLKSRRVVPGRLIAAGFAFRHPDWSGAARELVGRWR